jgi:hypothetical protein
MKLMPNLRRLEALDALVRLASRAGEEAGLK